MRYTEIINEYNRDVTAKNYAAKLVAAARRDRSLPAQFRDTREVQDVQLVDMVLDRIESSDPTPNKEYSQALAKIYGLGQTPFEDLSSTLADYLAKFHKLKQKKVIPSPRNDFMRYDSVADFMSVVDEYPDVEEMPTDKGASDQVYQDAQLRIIRPDDEAAACYYGQGTKWCTAAKNHNMFDRYNKQGSMYIILPKQPAYGGEKYQFHFPSAQFMDEQDRPTNIAALLERFPQLKDVFADEARAHGNIQFAFRGSNEEYKQIMQKLAQQVTAQMSEALQRGAASLSRQTAAAIADDVKTLRPVRSDLADMLEQDIVENINWWEQTVNELVSQTPEDLGTTDRMQEVFLEEADLMEWITQTSAWEFIGEQLERDPDADADDDSYHAAMSMQYVIADFVSDLAVRFYKQAVEEFTS